MNFFIFLLVVGNIHRDTNPSYALMILCTHLSATWNSRFMFMEGQCFSISVQNRTRTSPHVLTCLYACLALHGYVIAPSGCTPQPALPLWFASQSLLVGVLLIMRRELDHKGELAVNDAITHPDCVRDAGIVQSAQTTHI